MNTEKMLDEIIQLFSKEVKGIINDLLNDGARIMKKDVEQICKIMNTDVETLMLKLLRIAALYAKAPVSNYRVGAVALGESGSIYLGSNMEFAGENLSTSLHAEQAAVTNAWQNGEDGILKLAVTAAPCGYCRQFLNELSTADDLQILMPDNSGLHKTFLLPQILPEAFGPKDLDVRGGLMKQEDHDLVLNEADEDELVGLALKEANKSYAPYCRNFSGVSIKLKDGSIFGGRHAENAAHNPSLSPVHSALGFMNMNTKLGKQHEIVDAVLVETDSVISQKHLTETVLSSLGNINLRYYKIGS